MAAILLAIFAPQNAFLLLYGTAVAGMFFVWIVILLTHLRFRQRHGDRGQTAVEAASSSMANRRRNRGSGGNCRQHLLGRWPRVHDPHISPASADNVADLQSSTPAIESGVVMRVMLASRPQIWDCSPSIESLGDKP